MSDPFFTASTSGEPYNVEDVLELLEDCRNYITPTISTHEQITDILGWCGCGYCKDVPTQPFSTRKPNTPSEES